MTPSVEDRFARESISKRPPEREATCRTGKSGKKGKISASRGSRQGRVQVVAGAGSVSDGTGAGCVSDGRARGPSLTLPALGYRTEVRSVRRSRFRLLDSPPWARSRALYPGSGRS